MMIIFQLIRSFLPNFLYSMYFYNLYLYNKRSFVKTSMEMWESFKICYEVVTRQRYVYTHPIKHSLVEA